MLLQVNIFLIAYNLKILIKIIIILDENGEYWRLLNDGVYLVYAQSPDGTLSEPVEIQIENKPYTEAIQVNIEIESSENKLTYDQKYLNILKRMLYEKLSSSESNESD